MLSETKYRKSCQFIHDNNLHIASTIKSLINHWNKNKIVLKNLFQNLLIIMIISFHFMKLYIYKHILLNSILIYIYIYYSIGFFTINFVIWLLIYLISVLKRVLFCLLIIVLILLPLLINVGKDDCSGNLSFDKQNSKQYSVVLKR